MFEYRLVEDPTEAISVASAAFALRSVERETLEPWLRQALGRGCKLFGVYEGSRLQAVYLLHDYRMRLRESVIPMAGIGFVCSRLDARGKGAVRQLLAHSIETAKEQGHVVSVLDPFDQSFYRKYGWELFTRQQRLDISPASIAELPRSGDLEVEELPVPDQASQDFYNRYASTHYTLAQRSADHWEEHTRLLPWHVDHAAQGVVRVSRGGRVVGLIGYAVTHKPDQEATFIVDPFLYEGEDVKRELLGFLRRLSHQIGKIRLHLPVDEDLWPYLNVRPRKRDHRDTFMIRIVSVAALNGLRLAAPDGALAVDVTDPQASWNNGIWNLKIDRGTLHVSPGRSADLRCGIGVLSSVVSGFTSFARMIDAGKVEALPGYDGQDLPTTVTALADYF